MGATRAWDDAAVVRAGHVRAGGDKPYARSAPGRIRMFLHVRAVKTAKEDERWLTTSS